MNIRNAILLTGAVLALSACGSGGNQQVSFEEAQRLAGGIYEGTLDDANSGTQHTIQGAIDETGRIVLVDTTNPSVYSLLISNFQTSIDDGFFACYGATTTYGYTFPDGTVHQIGAVTGQFQQDVGVSGTVIGPKSECQLSNDGAPQSPFTLVKNTALYELPVTQASLQGVYHFAMRNFTVEWTVDETGYVLGTDSVGCNYNGPMTLVQSGANAFTVEVSRYCGSTQTIEGMAYVIPATETEPQKMWLAVTGNLATWVTPVRE